MYRLGRKAKGSLEEIRVKKKRRNLAIKGGKMW